MFWNAGGGMDPRLDGPRVSWSAGLNRWLVKHPVRGPVIAFIITGIIIGLSFIPGASWLIFLGLPAFLFSLFLLAYPFIRRVAESTIDEDPDMIDETRRIIAAAEAKLYSQNVVTESE